MPASAAVPPFGIDYRSPPGDWSFARVSKPGQVAFLDLTRRLTTRKGIIWWTSRVVVTTSDELEESLDLRELFLDSGGVAGLGSAIVAVCMASPFVDDCEILRLQSENGNVQISLLVTLKTGTRLTLSATVDVESGRIDWVAVETPIP